MPEGLCAKLKRPSCQTNELKLATSLQRRCPINHKCACVGFGQCRAANRTRGCPRTALRPLHVIYLRAVVRICVSLFLPNKAPLCAPFSLALAAVPCKPLRLFKPLRLTSGSLSMPMSRRCAQFSFEASYSLESVPLE